MSLTGEALINALPHGAGMKLLRGTPTLVEGWLRCDVALSPHLSVVDSSGRASAELGLEMMAQACGVFLAHESNRSGSGPRVGMVGAVRGYEYETLPFHVGEEISVRVKSDLCEESIIVCEAELYRSMAPEPSQRARITLILKDQGVV